MKIQDITKIKWKKGNRWQEKLFNTELCLETFSPKANPIYALFTREGCNTTVLNTQWHHEKKNYDKQENDLRKALANKIDLIPRIIKISEKYIKNSEAVLKEVESSIEINIELFSKVKKSFLLLWCIFNSDLGEFLPEKIREELNNQKLNLEEIQEVENYYFLNRTPLAFQKEEESLKKIGKIYKSRYKKRVTTLKKLPLDIKQLLNSHWEEFHWLMSDEIDTDYYTVEDYFERMKQFLSVKIANSKPKKKLSAKIKNRLDQGTLKFLELINRHLFIDNYAADLYIKLEFYLLERLSKQSDVSFRELSWYTIEELKQLIGGGLKLTKTQLDERKSHRVMVQIDDQIAFFYGKNNFNKISSLVEPTAQRGIVLEIKGIIASKGQAQGQVKIVRSIKDMGKVNEGDILVATTTRPDLMPAILKCAAIVTDAGGITSHAAIVSRELKIPCVVATKIATSVLKDGDFVEVDANEGIVKIMKNVR